MNKNCYFDFHVIQNVPPSCVNRDDTGSPKTAIYGGTMRARVSSQAWKRAIRQMFKETLSSELLGYRTKNISDIMSNEIIKLRSDMQVEDAKKISNKVLELAGIKSGEDKKDVLFFISYKQIKTLAELAVQYDNEAKSEISENETNDNANAGNDVTNENDGKKKKSKKNDEKESKVDKKYKEIFEKALIDNPSIDLLLFGRMAASNPSLNYDAAAQVAHSISTHTITNEYDYFTAVDDCAPEDNAGAGHLGTVEFNSATLYRYATVNIGELSKNLNKDELKIAIKAFADAFIRSMPTGKQNTFANRTLPNMVYVTMRDDQPINFAGAFEKPITAGENGYIQKSEDALLNCANEIYNNYTDAPKKAWLIGREDESIKNVNIKELLSDMEMEIDNIENTIA